jgi:hypothetical protein
MSVLVYQYGWLAWQCTLSVWLTAEGSKQQTGGLHGTANREKLNCQWFAQVKGLCAWLTDQSEV